MSPQGIHSFGNDGPPRNDPQKDFPKTHLKHLEIVVSLDFGWFLELEVSFLTKVDSYENLHRLKANGCAFNRDTKD